MPNYLQSKSEAFSKAAKLLHSNELYSTVAHSAYYSCFLLMKHIWLHPLNKTEQHLRQELKHHNQQRRFSGAQEMGSHEFLINAVGKYIKNLEYNDFHKFIEAICQLKRLRTSLDYDDTLFDDAKSSTSLSLAEAVILILEKYK
ncbi:MAG: hypothetical protein LBL94_10640 [Prevotellaceae bacterium]|jgi:hypothetical protein|nr:hypothetical protein [Prevotellaceae bacterium]